MDTTELQPATDGRGPTGSEAVDQARDIALLLRCHAEGCFLQAEVLPAARELERALDGDRDSLAVVRGNLRARCSQAQLQALATDASYEALRAGGADQGGLAHTAYRYYATVRALRELVLGRVAAVGGFDQD